MIQSWGNVEAKEVFQGLAPRAVPGVILNRARRLLAQLNAAQAIGDMRAPPGNRLHKLEGGEVWSVSVNGQYRVTFQWGPKGPENVWLGDYH
jgi:proteic killer suppression protein